MDKIYSIVLIVSSWFLLLGTIWLGFNTCKVSVIGLGFLKLTNEFISNNKILSLCSSLSTSSQTELPNKSKSISFTFNFLVFLFLGVSPISSIRKCLWKLSFLVNVCLVFTIVGNFLVIKLNASSLSVSTTQNGVFHKYISTAV